MHSKIFFRTFAKEIIRTIIMKLYLRPKGENGLPLHPIANVEECMKSYDKVVGELYTEQEVEVLLETLSKVLVYQGNEYRLPHYFEAEIKEVIKNYKK